MAFVELDDTTATIEVIVFANDAGSRPRRCSSRTPW